MQQSVSAVTPEKLTSPQVYHSPNTILSIYAKFLSTVVDNKLISVRGIYIGDPNAREYSGYVYESIKGENDNASLKIKVPVKVRSKLQSKQIYVFSGLIEKKIGNSTVELVFCIDTVLATEQSQYSEAELEGFKLIQRKVSIGFVDVEAKIRQSIYDNRKLRIANIFGESAIVDKDFTKGIAGAIVNFEIQNFRCNLSQPLKIIETLKGLSNMGYDIIAIVRGGGELSTLSEPAIANQVLQLKCAFVCAIGHAVNSTLLDKVADKSFELPLDYGVKLREIVERATEELTNSKSALLDKVRVELTKSFADTLKAKEENVKILQEQVKVAAARSAEMERQYQKLTEERVANAEKQNKILLDRVKREQRSSQFIALLIGFAIAMFIFYTFKS